MFCCFLKETEPAHSCKYSSIHNEGKEIWDIYWRTNFILVMLHTSTWYVLIFIDELILKLQNKHGKNGMVIPIPNSTEERFLVAIQSPIAHQVENQVVTHYICIKCYSAGHLMVVMWATSLWRDPGQVLQITLGLELKPLIYFYNWQTKYTARCRSKFKGFQAKHGKHFYNTSTLEVELSGGF